MTTEARQSSLPFPSSPTERRSPSLFPPMISRAPLDSITRTSHFPIHTSLRSFFTPNFSSSSSHSLSHRSRRSFLLTDSLFFSRNRTDRVPFTSIWPARRNGEPRESDSLKRTAPSLEMGMRFRGEWSARETRASFLDSSIILPLFSTHFTRFCLEQSGRKSRKRVRVKEWHNHSCVASTL